ncbi:aldehyde dehydrogenase [Sphingomonas sp. DBB INV C78]|uniref:aldehyde dehydrogenase n=1 Tax=Sphingomonas sp. DBB INV C78 TaxID=3349434 RepID=UPI0036D27C37
MIRRDKFLIGGQYVDPAGTELLKVISPITEEVIGEVPLATAADIDRAVAAARHAFEEGPWPRMSIEERGDYLERMIGLLELHIDEARDLQIAEMGGPLKLYGPQTPAMLGPRIREAISVAKQATLQEVRQGSYGKVVVSRTPLGVVGAIIPWNTPVAALMIKMLPAMLAGTPIILKPAPESPLSCYIIADALAQLGLPEGAVSIIPAGREVGEHLVRHRGVDKISFTGSTAAGRQIGMICGEQIKPATLELGGKSAAILLDDFDLRKTLPILERNSLTNTGQICIATTRILVSERRHDELVDALVERVGKMKVGNPFEADTDFGPLAAQRQRERVEAFIKAGRDAGAKVALGGGRPDIAKGWYVEPTIFTGVENDMSIAREEIFGPVLSIIRYKNEDEAIRIANASDYGLGGAIYSADIARGLAVAAQVQTGSCVINEGIPGGGGGPFGGIKQSGIGREQGLEGLYNHYYLKSVTLPMGVEPILEAAE